MRSRESVGAAQGRDESAVVAGRQSREQLGVYGDGVVGLEFEGLGGVVDDRGWTRRTGKGSTTIGKAKAFADGVHDVSSGDHRYTVSNRAERSSSDLSSHDMVEPVAGKLLRDRGSASILPIVLTAGRIEVGVRMLRSTMAF